MRTKSLAATAVGIALALLLAACIRPPGNDGSQPTQSPSAPGTAGAGTAGSPRPSPSGGSMEGQFTYATMDAYVDAVLDLITSFEYCAADHTIYLGQDTPWELYTTTGDAGPAFGVAHVLGHHIQQGVGVPAPQTAQNKVRYEHQATCIAGGWARYTDQQGWLEHPDDIEDINALLPLLGSAEGRDHDHGTASEWASAFQLGFGSGVPACTSFFPGYPLTPSA